MNSHLPNPSSVICTLPWEASGRCPTESYGRRIAGLQGYRAIHDMNLCLEDEPCVVMYKGCNSKNIARVLVHESIHHALVWLEADEIDDVFANEDKFDEVVDKMAKRGFSL
jgi:hypothetical protein